MKSAAVSGHAAHSWTIKQPARGQPDLACEAVEGRQKQTYVTGAGCASPSGSLQLWLSDPYDGICDAF
jgi:hypothetical protein